MGLFDRISDHDRAQLRSALQSLGSSTVAGLAAALSWSPKKTDRALRDLAARAPTPVAYDVQQGQARWIIATSSAPKAEQAPSTPPAERPPLPVRASGSAPIVTPSIGPSASCPSCHTALAPTGSPGMSFCPTCGRLSTPPIRASGGPSPSVSPAPAAPTGAAPLSISAGLSDRRSQELFAAWVTAQPIPCPKCRMPLRHHGVGEYACPSCGQQVRFATAPSAAGPSNAPAPPLPTPSPGRSR